MDRTPSFPTAKDLSALQQNDANAALAELRRLVRAGLADVYTRPFTPVGERPRWNIWLDRRVWPAGDQRVELTGVGLSPPQATRLQPQW